MKNKIVLQPNRFSSFTSWYLEPLWQQYFDIEIYDPTKTYDRKTLFVSWCFDAQDPIVESLSDRGCKIVIDNLWETPRRYARDYYILTSPNWVWWNEALWWHALGYDQYQPNKAVEKTALMPIRRIDPVRDKIVDQLGPLKHSMLWSYRDQRLPNDNYIGQDVDQRFMNPQWYDSTYMSLVVETRQQGQIYHITDKTFKPCAYYHPMMIIGQQHSLAWLKQRGFETFDNIFDESYDQEPDFEKRLKIIMENLKSLEIGCYSTETQLKLQHNHCHFFDQHKATQGIIQEIIEPLRHYAET